RHAGARCRRARRLGARDRATRRGRSTARRRHGRASAAPRACGRGTLARGCRRRDGDDGPLGRSRDRSRPAGGRERRRRARRRRAPADRRRHARRRRRARRGPGPLGDGLRRIAAQRPEGALAPVVSRPHDLLVTLLVGITLINIGASALATHTAHALFGPRWGLLVELIAMVVLLTTFGEVLPMTLAVKYPERFLAVVERPVRWLEWLLAPIRGVLAGLTTLTVRLLGRGAETQAALSEEELRTLVDVGASEGVVEREEREMIHKVFELEDTLVR